MEFYYSAERGIQILVSLLKQYGIKKIVASPGSSNVSLVESLQNDPFFEMYSMVDERSAAYLACGLAQESGEAVVLTCTSATASRNYVPGLTEAYYRHLPILAITATTQLANVGHLQRQSMDRSSIQKDIANMSVLVRVVKDKLDEWDCIIKVNKALSELFHRDGGPVHINLETEFSMDFSVRELPKARIITRIETHQLSQKPIIDCQRVGVFIGSHDTMSQSLISAIDAFCERNNAICLIDHTSHYNGRYGINYSILGMQEYCGSQITNLDLVIHLGMISGDDPTTNALKSGAKEVWRVSKDGEIIDTFGKLKYVFEMDEELFFKQYSIGEKKGTSFYDECIQEYNTVISDLPELPFSNLWIAKSLYDKLPKGSRVQLGILHSFRSWTIFSLDPSIKVYSNVGGFGIDGGMSSLIGSALCDKNRIYYGIFGDLQFFYDMNVLGIRDMPSNVRIILINNGKGNEFRNYHHTASIFGEDTDKFIAAAGHFGNKSKTLVKHYAEDLGFRYFSADNKEQFNGIIPDIIALQNTESPLLVEVFTDTEHESKALELVSILHVNKSDHAVRKLKDFGKSLLPDDVLAGIRKRRK